MRELLGGCLIAVGVVIAGLTGLCCGALFMNSIITDPLAALGGIAVYAGIPIAIGVGLIFAGRSLIRSARGDRY
jgi:hypothetical protein